MANNYLQYSTQYNFPREVNQEEADQLLEKMMRVGAKIYAEEQMGSTVEDEYGEVPDYTDIYVGTSLEIEPTGAWFYDEEGGELDVVIGMLQVLQDYFEDDRLHVFSWAYTCSKMRVDEFGGGAAGVQRGKEPYFIDAGYHVSENMKENNPFTTEERNALFEAARIALADAGIFEDLTDKLDINDSEMSKIVEKLQKFMDAA